MAEPSPIEVLTACQDGDVVYLLWPDGSETLVKGKAFLERIVETGLTKEAAAFRIPVSNQAEAELIRAMVQIIEKGDLHLDMEATFLRLLPEARDKYG